MTNTLQTTRPNREEPHRDSSRFGAEGRGRCRSAIMGVMLLAATLPALAAAEDKVPAKTSGAAPWESVTDELFKRIEVYDMKPEFIRRCVGMAVTPAGEVFVVTSKNHGVCVSKDQGATWTEIEGNKVTGRCETGFGFSIAYPYDGRLAFFTIDGNGGITLDGGKTWRPFGKILRMFEFADVDWGTKEPRTLFGLLHEPFFTVLSTDGGSSWQQLYKEAEAPNGAQNSVKRYHLGIIDANALVRSHPDQPGIVMSTDAGKTWTEVAKYKVLGRRPVHFGKKVFWTTSEGVIVTTGGKDWTLTGKGPEKATYGPYFGASEQEFMVVSDKAFFLTRDGGKTWKDVAPVFFPPEGPMKGFFANGQFNYFGWDSTNNLIYSSSLGGSVYRLKLQP